MVSLDGVLPESLSEPLTVAGQVAAALRDAILSGRIAAGERLNQEQVARRLGVSRIPVREALWTLQSEGLLALKPHRGAVVVDLSIEEVREIFEIRAVLEGLAIERTALRAGEDDLERCEVMLGQMDVERDAGRWLALNAAWHERLYRSGGAGRLLTLIQTLRRDVDRFLRISILVVGRIPEYQIEHRGILAAVRRRDVRTARTLVEAHLLNTATALDAFLKQRQGQTSGAGGGEGRSGPGSGDGPAPGPGGGCSRPSAGPPCGPAAAES